MDHLNRLVIILLLLSFGSVFHLAFAQGKPCGGIEVTVKTKDSKGRSEGEIILTVENQQLTPGKFLLYRISGVITLVRSTQYTGTSNSNIVFDKLDEGDYLIKTEWGDGCSQTVGGIEGIQIRDKAH